MTTTKYSKQNQKTAAGPQGSFVQDDLVHLVHALHVKNILLSLIQGNFPKFCMAVSFTLRRQS